MQTQPAIIITRRDAERIESLLERAAAQASPGVERLQDELLRAQVVAPDEVPGDVVTMNSTVRFRIEGTSKEFSLKLVYPHDADGTAEKVSILAPIGSALLGLREGQAIDWPMPGGTTAKVRILEVVDQPERRGDYQA